MKSQFENRTNRDIVINMAEFSGPADLYRIIGSPAGFARHGEPCLLDKVLQSPKTRVIIEEPEKAHSDIISALFYKDKKTGLYKVKPKIKRRDGKEFSLAEVTFEI